MMTHLALRQGILALGIGWTVTANLVFGQGFSAPPTLQGSSPAPTNGATSGPTNPIRMTTDSVGATGNAGGGSASVPSGSSVMSQIRTYDVPLEMVGVVGARLTVLYGKDNRVTVTTEPGTGRLMVMAPPSIHSDIGGRVDLLLKELNLASKETTGQPAAPNTSTQNGVALQRHYKLNHITWRELEDSLTRLSGPRMTVTTLSNGELAQFKLIGDGGVKDVLQVDRRADSVILQGPSTNVYSWLQVIGALDQPKEASDQAPKIVPLAPADPTRVERALTLVRTASMRRQFDEDDDDSIGSAQFGPRGGGDGQALAIDGVEQLGAETGLFGDVQVAFVPELGLVIVRGSKRDVQRVLELIEQIKQQSQQTQPEIEILMLKHVDSQALETIVRELYTEVLAPRQGQISIRALVQPNALLLVGRRESVASVIELVKKLDQPLEVSGQLRVYKLLHTSAVDADRLIRDFFVERPGSGQDLRTGLGTRVRVISDYRTNALVVQASPRDHLEVARLIAEIDVESTPAQNELKVFPLKYALAAELQPILQTAITGQTTGQIGQQQQGTAAGQVTPPSSNLTIVSRGRDRLDSGILAGVVVTSNPSINSLIVRAPSKSMELISALIEQLDQPPSAEAELKVFEIRNGDATSLALLSQQLFGLPATAGAATTGVFGGAQQGLGQLGSSQGGIVPLRVTVDTRTNSIIASGSAVDLEVLEVLLMRLDEEGIETRTTEVIWLRNSNATNVANAISNLLNIQRSNIQQLLLTGQAISIFEQIDREVIVVAEPTTNSLIVSATPRYAERIREVIDRLDRRPPMIMVQILLAEVSLDDRFEWGAELGLQDSLLFNRNSATGGTLGSPGFNMGNVLTRTETLGSPGNVAGQGLSSFGLGRTSQAAGYGGMVLSAASDSVSVLMRALQDANRLQILSRPQVMTLDTVAAFVQVGQQVPRITGVQAGNQLAPPIIITEDVNTGLIMRIQPRTNQDGLILLDVQVERSNVGPDETGIPVGFGPQGEVIRSPLINVTRAETRVSAYDGQTVVFAGLITKQRETRSRRVPFLADIPLVGNLFKFDTEAEQRTELLVVMTPRIVKDPEDVEMINQIESARMSWCLADVLNMHGVVGLSEGNGLWGPNCSPVIYPDLNPTIEFGDYSDIRHGMEGHGFPMEGGVHYPMIESGGQPTPAVTPQAAPRERLLMPGESSSTVTPAAPIQTSYNGQNATGQAMANGYGPYNPAANQTGTATNNMYVAPASATAPASPANQRTR